MRGESLGRHGLRRRVAGLRAGERIFEREPIDVLLIFAPALPNGIVARHIKPGQAIAHERDRAPPSSRIPAPVPAHGRSRSRVSPPRLEAIGTSASAACNPSAHQLLFPVLSNMIVAASRNPRSGSKRSGLAS